MDFSNSDNALEWLQNVTKGNFEDKTLELFRWQAANCEIYKQYIDLLKIDPAKIQSIHEIPFLPIQFFKSHDVLAKGEKSFTQFESSGTTGQVRSKHSVAHPEIYHWTGLNGFKENFGDIEEWHILALLPSYLERNNASLVYMCQQWISHSKSDYSGFYLDNLEGLHKTLETLLANDEKVLLMGVSFALLDLAEQFNVDLSKAIIMETGGMKGRRKEMIRAELHDVLKASFQTDKIYSEYGMTELLSQAYTKGGDLFFPPDYMRVLPRNHTDPFEVNKEGNGALNVIDLANIYSCSFIETQDLGHVNADLSFEVKGRMDISEVRGCNLMIG